jgi:subtilase family serine protease
VTGVSTDGTSINCVYPRCDDTEQTLDITQALGMAPGVTTLYVYVGSSDTALLGGMSSGSPLPLSLSSSWSWKPADPQTDDPYFEKMAAQGQTFFQAAGDSGNWAAGQYVYPNEDAYVVSVGGTDLTTTGAGGAWATESTWVDGGGGISPDHIAIPAWQQLAGVITGANRGSTTYRNGPDVSANSNFTFYVCADQQACTANYYGGTSFAAPMWAGYIALANQQAAKSSDPAPGFINPTVYPLGLGSNYSNLFHDITSGSNGFPAVVGYDLATAWGSPNGDALINVLAPAGQGSFTISANPNSLTIAKGQAGMTRITSTITNGFNAAVTLTTGLHIVRFLPDPIPAPGSGMSAMKVSVPATAPVGKYIIIVKGSGGGVQVMTTVYLNITN